MRSNLQKCFKLGKYHKLQSSKIFLRIILYIEIQIIGKNCHSAHRRYRYPSDSTKVANVFVSHCSESYHTKQMC